MLSKAKDSLLLEGTVFLFVKTILNFISYYNIIP